MNTNSTRTTGTAICTFALTFLVGSSLALAQDQTPAPPPDNQQQSAPATGEWRKVGDPAPGQAAQQNPPADTGAPGATAPQAGPPGPQPTMDPDYAQGPPPPPPNSGEQYPNAQAGPGQYPPSNYPPSNYPPSAYPQGQYPQGQYPQGRYPQGQYPPYRQYGQQYPPAASYNRGPVPAKLTLKPGTFVTVRLTQGLSSDRNHDGDAFSATLAKPVIVDGVVVAERGQTVGGHVVEAKKAGRVEGVSRLKVQLTDLTLSDGQPVPIQTQLYSKNGPTSVGRDAAAIGATTATGAAIGAAAGWGTGAAIGAGAGALAGIVGVLVTRGRPTVLYPEQILTFRVEQPVNISTETAQQAFRWVNPGDYERPYEVQRRPAGPGYGYGYPYPYANPYAYSYPYYWGPSVGFYWGPGYWGRGWGRWGWRR